MSDLAEGPRCRSELAAPYLRVFDAHLVRLIARCRAFGAAVTTRRHATARSGVRIAVLDESEHLVDPADHAVHPAFGLRLARADLGDAVNHGGVVVEYVPVGLLTSAPYLASYARHGLVEPGRKLGEALALGHLSTRPKGRRC